MENLKYSEILRENRSLGAAVNGTPYKVSVLSNVTVNSLKEILEYNLRLNGINPALTIGNYDNIVQDSAASGGADLVVIIYDALNIVDSVFTFFEDLDAAAYRQLQQRVFAEIDIIFRNLKDAPSVIFNYFSSRFFVSGYTQRTKLETFVAELNAYLEAKKTANISLLDIDKIIAQIGTRQAIDYRLYYSSKAPYTLAFLKSYVAAMEPIILRQTGKLKKALIFDCDNTLWKGIIGEDGMEQIDMSRSSAYGRLFHTVQQIAVYLSRQGVIIGICSKNNEQDVTEVFLNHPDMVLREEHIVIRKVNWEDKATNLLAIASELNIGIDSLVFVDDSSFEINLIKEQLPEVTALQIPSSIYEYPDFLLRNVYKYFNLAVSAEDAKKTEIYKQQFERESAKAAHGTMEDYLASLEIVLTIKRDDAASVPRIAQLTQKTNQFNLTTQRYTEAQIQAFMDKEQDQVFSVGVRDKFGDNGLTAVCIIRGEEGTAVIDSLLMSCRVIGRKIEHAFMDHILLWLKGRSYTRVTGAYIPTKKNAQVAHFYEELGFTVTSEEDGAREYTLDLVDYTDKPVGFIQIEA